MYIIELFVKIFDNIKQKKKKEQDLPIEKESCSHIFLPIDSTGRILACSKCGEIYKQEEKLNPFKQE